MLRRVHSAARRPAIQRLRGGVTSALASAPTRAVSSPKGNDLVASGGSAGFDFGLLACFAGWYLGNYYYTLNNKYALKAAGGATGFPVTIGFMQMVIGSVYALFLWLAPDARTLPNVTPADLMKILPVATCAAGAHISSIFSMNLGAVSFAQIVKAAEPAFAALLGVTLYGKSVSKAKWLCLIPVIGGVCIASLKEVRCCLVQLASGSGTGGWPRNVLAGERASEQWCAPPWFVCHLALSPCLASVHPHHNPFLQLDFSVVALLAACIANLFAAFRANENKKLMDTEGLKVRTPGLGCSGAGL